MYVSVGKGTSQLAVGANGASSLGQQGSLCLILVLPRFIISLFFSARSMR